MSCSFNINPHFDHAELSGCTSSHSTVYALNVPLVSTTSNCEIVPTAISCNYLPTLFQWYWTFRTCSLVHLEFITQLLPMFYFQFVCNAIFRGYLSKSAAFSSRRLNTKTHSRGNLPLIRHPSSPSIHATSLFHDLIMKGISSLESE